MQICVDTAISREELLSALGGLAIDVPSRADGRTKEMCEQWMLHRLLSGLAVADQLVFPISVKRAAPPNPDFILNSREASIGIEVTEATSEDYSDFLNFLDKKEKMNPAESRAIFELASFRPKLWKRHRRRQNKIQAFDHEASKSYLTTAGWSGNEPEQEWAHYIENAVKKKLAKIKYYRQTCQELWLVVYVNAPLPSIHYKEALNILTPKIAEILSLKNEDVRDDLDSDYCRLDAIFLLDGSKIISFDQAIRSKIYDVSHV